jgi:hypothetical protein
MKLSRLTLWLGLLPPMFTACATISPPQPPSLELPTPPADLHALRKGDRVILTWTVPDTTTDRQTMRALGTTRVCRTTAIELKDCGTPLGEAAAAPGPSATGPASPRSAGQKSVASYTDSLTPGIDSVPASGTATYAVEVFNREGRSAGLSNQVRVPLVRTLAAPQDFQARVMGQGVILSWRGSVPPSQSNVRYVYRVYRRLQSQPQWTLVGEVPVSDENPATLTDSGIEWENTYDYRAEAVTLISQAGKPSVQVEGEDTPITTVLAHDIFPPAVPSGLQAVFSGPGQKPFVDLVWAPVPDIDLAGYNVYRHEAGTAARKVNAEVVKTPSYRDAAVEPGKPYFYSVSSVDERGNESHRSQEASETVP